MDKLRTSYKKYQSQIMAPNPRYVASDRSLKLKRLAQIQLQNMRQKQDFANYDEAVFYKQKFSKFGEIAQQLQQKKISDQIYHSSIRQVAQNNFNLNGPRSSSNQQVNVSFGNSQVVNSRIKSKSPLKQFFDQQELKVSNKINFSHLLAKDQTPLKYGFRSVSRSKKQSEVRPKNNEQLQRLQEQNRQLKQRLNHIRNNSPEDQNRLKQLRDRIRQLDEQNLRLRSEVSKSSRSDFYTMQEYDPYNIKVRQNNIVKIHNKNLYASEKMSHFGGISEDYNRQKKHSQVYFDKQAYLRPITPSRQQPFTKSKLYSENDILNASQSSIQTQFLNLENNELYDEIQNQVCRQKIAFFKKEMVIFKSNDFDIAFKRSDLNSLLDKMRLILYINNKTAHRFNCVIQYDYDREDFDIVVRKKISNVESRTQGRQQIQVYLKNTFDLGSLITAKILVGQKMKKIVIPALFIDFNNDYKYQFENISHIEQNLSQPLVIRPMSQFTTVDRTSNVIELTREYEQKYEVAKMFGKSKACKGIVKLTWKRGNKLKIQTCEEWKTLMGYLFLNAEETINY